MTCKGHARNRTCKSLETFCGRGSPRSRKAKSIAKCVRHCRGMRFDRAYWSIPSRLR